MKTIKLILVFLFVTILSLSAQIDLNDLLIGDWYAQGYGKKKIQINDSVLFTKEKIECTNKNCDFIKWTFKSNGDFEECVHFDRVLPNGQTSRSVIMPKYVKWGLIKKNNELILADDKVKSIYKIFLIDKSRLNLTRIK